MAQGISMLAIPWYFAQQDGMAQFGFVYVLTNAVALFWVPYSGTLIDRYNRKTIFLVLTAVVGLLLFSISGLGFYHQGLPWQLVAAVFMLTFLNYNVHYPNLYAFVQEIAEPSYYGKITSYLEIQGQLTAVMAGAGAALLLEGTSEQAYAVFGYELSFINGIEAWHIHEIFLLDASTYFVAFLIISFIHYQPLAKRRQEEGSLYQRLMVGVDYLRQNTSVLLFGFASYTTFIAVLITTFYLAANYVNVHLLAGGDVFATSEIFYAVGAVFAGVAIRRIFARLTLPMSVIIMTIGSTALFAVLFASKSIAIFYAMNFVLGLTNAGIRIQRVTWLFSKVPNQVYGRANSVFNLLNISCRISLLLLFSLPFFHQDNNVIYGFLILSLFLLAAAILLLYHYTSFVELEKELD